MTLGRHTQTQSGPAHASMRFHTIEPILVFITICLISYPSFFEIYRVMAFDVIPRDNYAPFLLHLVGGKGSWPGSPFGYRVLSVLAAAPFYWVLPIYKFSLLPKHDIADLRALQALAFLSFVSSAGSATVAFQLFRRRLGSDVDLAALAAVITIVLSAFFDRTGLDAFGIFVIFAFFYWLERVAIFTTLFLLVPFINEKIIVFFLLLLISRSIFVSGFAASHRWQTGSVVIALLIYLSVLAVVRLPGNEFQIASSHWLPHLGDMTLTSVSSIKGVVLNVLPVFVIITPCALLSFYHRTSTELTAVSDLIVPLGLLITALVATFGYTVGHVVSYALPLTVISSTILLAPGSTSV